MSHKILIALALFFTVTPTCSAGNPPRKFLSHLVEVHPVTHGSSIEFTGEFVKIPDKLQQQLEQSFPAFRFSIAKMQFSHWGPEDVNLLLVTSAKSGNVLVILWEEFFQYPSYSFRSWLTSELREPEASPFTTDEEIRKRLILFSKLYAVCRDAVYLKTISREKRIQVVLAAKPDNDLIYFDLLMEELHEDFDDRNELNIFTYVRQSDDKTIPMEDPFPITRGQFISDFLKEPIEKKPSKCHCND